MSDHANADFLREVRENRDWLRRQLADRLAAGARLGPVLYGMAALTGDMAAIGANPGMLDVLLNNLAGTMRENAALQLDGAASHKAHGHG